MAFLEFPAYTEIFTCKWDILWPKILGILSYKSDVASKDSLLNIIPYTSVNRETKYKTCDLRGHIDVIMSE